MEFGRNRSGHRRDEQLRSESFHSESSGRILCSVTHISLIFDQEDKVYHHQLNLDRNPTKEQSNLYYSNE